MGKEGADDMTSETFYRILYSVLVLFGSEIVGYVPIHWEDARRISPQGDTMPAGESDKMLGGWELGQPSYGGGDVGSGIGGVRDICCLPPETSHTIH